MTVTNDLCHAVPVGAFGCGVFMFVVCVCVCGVCVCVWGRSVVCVC